ncbi:unnamed protein product [Orchesella dallaii]|uniref:Uncharacterized protein n=1 Tax=Orchesella dallaii TaxID=48710 RepID=A0ABP1RS25_9HEXA
MGAKADDFEYPHSAIKRSFSRKPRLGKVPSPPRNTTPHHKHKTHYQETIMLTSDVKQVPKFPLRDLGVMLTKLRRNWKSKKKCQNQRLQLQELPMWIVNKTKASINLNNKEVVSKKKRMGESKAQNCSCSDGNKRQTSTAATIILKCFEPHWHVTSMNGLQRKLTLKQLITTGCSQTERSNTAATHGNALRLFLTPPRVIQDGKEKEETITVISDLEYVHLLDVAIFLEGLTRSNATPKN